MKIDSILPPSAAVGPTRARAFVAPTRFELFRAGCMAPSLTSLIGAVLVCGLWIGWCAVHITPRWVARHATLLTTSRKDEMPTLGAKAVRLGITPPPGPTLVLVGNSSLREALTSEPDLARRLSAAAGKPLGVTLLAAGGIGHLDEVALTDQFLGRLHGAIALEISQYELSVDPAGVRRTPGEVAHDFPCPSEARRLELQRMGVRTPWPLHNFFLDSRTFFAARADRIFSYPRDNFEVRQHLFETRPPWSEKDWRGPVARQMIGRWEASYLPNRTTNFAIYARLLRRLRDAGLRPSLLQMVENPRNDSPGFSHHPGEGLRQQYLADLRAFAASQNVLLVEGLAAEAALSPTDFSDYVHLRAHNARTRYTQCLAARLAPLFDGRGGATLTPPTFPAAATRRHRRGHS